VAVGAAPVDADAVEQVFANLDVGLGEAHRPEIELLLTTEGELEGFERIKLGFGGQSEVLALDPMQRLREMLDHGADRERAQRAVPWRAVT
jgi:hypothetical protein